jgi:hypothetical protein
MRILAFVACAVVMTAAVGSADGTSTHKVKKRKPTAPTVSVSCKVDADCAMTKYADNECCPSLCQPRAVAKKSAEALTKYGKECKKSALACEQPTCPPPQSAPPVAACVEGQCAVKAAPAADQHLRD